MAKTGKSNLRKVVKILCFTLLIILGLQGATQYIAHQFGYAQSLGEPLARWESGFSIYGFWRGLEWFFALKAHYGTHDGITRVFGIAGYISAGVLLFAVVAMRFLFRRAGISANETLHGSARWAEQDDIIKAGLLGRRGRENEEGVVVGGWLSKKEKLKSLKVLRHNGAEHILVYAPTRSGKGVGLVLPTLLEDKWKGSTLILDIKGENYNLTAGFRKEILEHNVFRFNPSDPSAAKYGTSATFNPLEEIMLDYEDDPKFPDRLRRKELSPEEAEALETSTDGNAPEDKTEMNEILCGEVASIQNLATIIADPLGQGLDDHWKKTGHDLLVGTMAHMLYVGRRNGYCPSLSDISYELSKPGIDWIENLKGWQSYPHLGYEDAEKTRPICHPIISRVAQRMIGKDPREGSSVLSTAQSFLTLYEDPIISANTRVSSFKLRDLMHMEKPVDLYFTIEPTHKSRLQPFIRLFITQLVNALCPGLAYKDGRVVKSYKHRLLLLLDEFPTLGKLPIFQEALAFIAGYGLKSYLITQDLRQLNASYGKEESITSNCHISIAYAPNNQETAKYLSEEAGVATVVKESVSESGKRTDVFHNQTSVSIQEYSRPLLTPNECRTLPGAKKDIHQNIIEPGDMLILPTGYPAIYGKQTLYFLNKTLNERAKRTAPKKSDHVIDMIAKQLEIAAIKERLMSEDRELGELEKELKETPEDKTEKISELKKKIEGFKKRKMQNRSREPKTIGLPPRR